MSEVFQAAALAQRDRPDNELTTGWLISVCKNKVIDRWRAESVRQSKSHMVVERFGRFAVPPPDQALDLRDSSVLLALDRTSDRHRTLLILHHIDGMPISELCTATGLSKSAIESALARARRSFRREYERLIANGGEQ